MVFTRYCRSFIEGRSLAPPWPMTEQEARRYRCWQRYARRIRFIDSVVHSLRVYLVKQYNAELAEINANDISTESTVLADGKAAFTRKSGGPYAVSKHFEAERWRRS